MAFASRRIDQARNGFEETPTGFAEDQRVWKPRPSTASPALARMRERLDAARRPAVPSISRGGANARAPQDVLDAIDGGVTAIRPATVPAGTPAHLGASVERYMRLRGHSGRSYVFSRIEARHVSLYRNGVFATAARGAGHAKVIGESMPILSNAIADDYLYVHLLSETDGDRAAVVADLA